MVFIFNDCVMFHSGVYFMLKSFKLLTNKCKKLCNECLGVVHTVCPVLKSTLFLIAVYLSMYLLSGRMCVIFSRWEPLTYFFSKAFPHLFFCIS